MDDPRNGCWLPNQLEDRPKMPEWLRNAVPHRKIHRDSYYEWIGEEINRMRVRNLSDLLGQLRLIRLRLQSGRVKPKIAQGTGIA
ncbi:MAG: AHH domain-containing protein [Endozoicomonas sp.]|uniref:AHH domain-containing protein n=1 Tax=Endozoicomonas sp. TaxID=1892382 RepID=UPI003D9B8C21